MRLVKRQVKTLILQDGQCPFDEWLNQLIDMKAVAAIDARILRASTGNLGDFKSIGGGILELRIYYGSGYRLYVAQTKGTIIVLILGGSKASQRSDIQYAQSLWKEFKNEPERFR